ncbi:hypothetical protein H7F15_08345 [Pontibacter sp. Tf4]|uniref:hypothetical protein n=1 Tax=Pontibacter sp. Tf4 TaxID=2761620 RepID=UPI001624C250|nr:hypothetical protein [Pontibacter sp. Tf4]MBB6611043.1 hypothetical protein [Pontibacter sp. Tf4]
MKKYRTAIVGLAVLGLVSCTSLSEGEEGMPGVDRENRVRYRGDANAGLRDRMDEQASEINRKKNIEETNRNAPAMKPPEVRPEQLPNAPVDTTKHSPRRVTPRRTGN